MGLPIQKRTQMDIRKTQALVTDVIRSQQNSPVEDARAERAKATFDVAKLSVYINESQENIDRRRAPA